MARARARDRSEPEGRRLKVLHFSSLDGHTGAGIAAARIHQGLLQRGVQSRFCVAYPSQGLAESFTPALSPPQRILRSLTIRADQAKLKRDPRSDYVVSSGGVGFDMAKIARAEQPDVVQLHWIAGTSFRLDTLAAIEAPLVWRLSDMWPFCGIQHLEPDPAAYTAPPRPGAADHSEQVRLRKQAIYARVRDLTLACPSRWMAAEAGRSALLGDRPIERVPTSCDTALFRPIEKAACRQVLGLVGDADTILVGATSMGTSWKGGDLFIEAVRRLGTGRSRPLRVLTFGRDPLDADALAGAAEVVHLGMGDRRLMTIAFGAADVFVAPSRMENLANTVLEAMACGVPVAAFSIGGMPDMIDHQVNGWLSPAFDTTDLSQGIGWLLENSAARKLGAAARAKIEREFSIDAEIDRYLDIYRARLENRAAAART